MCPKGLVVHAISAIDNALWDLIGNALGMPVYKPLGGETKSRIPAYCGPEGIYMRLPDRPGFGFELVTN